MAINELPSSIRFYRENLILAGLWQGKNKPPYFQYISRFCEIAHNLYNNGFAINDNGNQVQVRIGVFLSTVDLPTSSKHVSV